MKSEQNLFTLYGGDDKGEGRQQQMKWIHDTVEKDNKDN